MASMLYTLYKNDGSNASEEFVFEPGSTFPDAAILFNESTLEFIEWNESADGTSTSYSIGDMIPDMGDYYAIWETPDPVPYITTDQELKSIADAIRAKGGTSAPLAFPAEFVSAIGAIPSGGGGEAAASNDVNFLDYDGTIVHSYTAAEFAALTALPANPSHAGLTAQGWNWSLSDAKAYVAAYAAAYGKLNIGQMYITDDGKTRIYIHLEEGRLSPYLGVKPNGSVEIDWGDGSAHDTVTGTSASTFKSIRHTYSASGDYVIALTVTGNVQLSGGSYSSRILSKVANNASDYVYTNAIQKVEIGSGVGLGAKAFQSCYSLASITIPSSVTSIVAAAFQYCYSLASITIPSGVTSIEGSAFSDCNSLASITIPSGVTSIGSSVFSNCNSLASITIPSGVTSIGSSVFSNCNSLASITIPSSVTSIGGSTFQHCYSLASITIPSSVMIIGGSTFQSCYGLASITIPSGVTSIMGSTFQRCYSLASITIPSGVTSIGGSAFQYCYSLASITIPSSVTSIGSSVFSNCYGLGFVRFESSTPPTVSNNNAWNNLPTDCKIYVPAGSLSAYTSATNYPSSRTYTYVEY